MRACAPAPPPSMGLRAARHPACAKRTPAASVDVGVKANIGPRKRGQDHGLSRSRRTPGPRTAGRPAARLHRRFRRLQNTPSPADLAFQSRLERQGPPYRNHAHTVSPDKPLLIRCVDAMRGAARQQS